MAGEHRRVAAQSATHAQGLTDSLTKQGFTVESRAAHEWVLRKKRRRGDCVVTITITQPSMVQPASPRPAESPEGWAPPQSVSHRRWQLALDDVGGQSVPGTD